MSLRDGALPSKQAPHRVGIALGWVSIRRKKQERGYSTISPRNGIKEIYFMMVLITYDVSTVTEAGKSRLRKVAKKCKDYGQRVQNSVFECIIDPAQLKQLQNSLLKIIDPEVDSLRFYYLGDKWKSRIEHIGAKPSIDMEGTIIA